MKTEIIAYELRDLTADDIFPMIQIISKIGIKEFKTCFESADVKTAIAQSAQGTTEADLDAVGMLVAFDVAGIIMNNLPKAKEDIYCLLSQLSGISKKEIATLPMVTFAKMVIDVIKKEEFIDFFQVVSTSFK